MSHAETIGEIRPPGRYGAAPRRVAAVSLAGILALLAALGLGLSAGAILAEGAVLVPFWRSLPAEEFLRWYRQHAELLLHFFGPLEVVSTVLVIAAAAVSAHVRRPGTALLALAAVLAIAVLLSFPLYFQAANASFAAGTIAAADVPAELGRWAAWHWGRTLIGITAFGATLVAVRRGASEAPLKARR